MRLPHADRVLVEREKITNYLLNPEHPDNGGKAAFFAALGFHRNNWTALASAFESMALDSPVTKSLISAHGEKYIVDGPIESPSGKTPTVGTVWIVERGQDIPRLITAYPQEGPHD